jgi:hypothetical protein
VSGYTTPPLEEFGEFHEGELDTRAYSFARVLSFPGQSITDTVASVVSIVATRTDGQSMSANDLTITPAGAASPWITNGQIVTWWQAAGADIAANGPVTYQIEITVQTAGGRTVKRDCLQTVYAAVP